MMNADQLFPASKAALDQLLEGILGALKSEEDCPHVSAISETNLDRDSPLVIAQTRTVPPGTPIRRFKSEQMSREQMDDGKPARPSLAVLTSKVPPRADHTPLCLRGDLDVSRCRP